MVQIVERFRREADEPTASELRNVLTMLLNLRYDEEDEATAATLSETSDIATLERRLRRLLTANTWAELLTSES